MGTSSLKPKKMIIIAQNNLIMIMYDKEALVQFNRQ